MRLAVLGSGQVGSTLAEALADAGHEVALGSRSADAEALTAVVSQRPDIRTGTYADVAESQDVVINATPGLASVEVISGLSSSLGAAVLWDVANPLAFDDGVAVVHPGGRSLAEQLQAAVPDNPVVKALNTVNTSVMVQPADLGTEHQIFLCGDDTAAKTTVMALLADLGWQPGQVLDLGDLTAARGAEQYLLLWLRLMSTLGSPQFNIQVVQP